jgi:sugar lactone lactonase YvrE
MKSLRHTAHPGVLLIGLIALSAPALCRAQSYTITTVVGRAASSSGIGDGGPAIQASLTPTGLAFDATGNLYIADSGNNLIRMVTPAGVISTVAGTLSLGFGYSGDGGPATSAQLNVPDGVADLAGNLYIADSENGCVRKVTPDGTITTVAGGGFPPIPGVGDGGPATSASLASPAGLAVDSGGNLYIADSVGNRVRKVTPDGTITTVAGQGSSFSSSIGDGGPATKAVLNNPNAVAVDSGGNLYIADSGNNRIRIVSTNGTITTVAGSNSGSYSGDGGPATSAGLSLPFGVAVDAAGNLYIGDTGDQRIRMVTPDGTISTIAGNGNVGSSGDGGPAINAEFHYPTAIVLDSSGDLYVADSLNYTVRLLTVNAMSSSAFLLHSRLGLSNHP